MQPTKQRIRIKRRGARGALALIAASAAIAVIAGPAAARPFGAIDRVSVTETGAQLGKPSGFTRVSNDGSLVAFISDDRRLVEGDTNGDTDVFVLDRSSGEIARVSVASDGAQAPGPYGHSLHIAISGNGRFVAFATESPGLVPDDTGGRTDVFVHDRVTRETSRVSVASDGRQANGDSFEPSLSGDGRYVAFQSVSTNISDVAIPRERGIVRSYVHDTVTERTRLVSVSSREVPANGHSTGAAMSDDGRLVAFDSEANNLVPRDTNGRSDVFVRNVIRGTTHRVSRTFRGGQARGSSSMPSISAEGRFVAFMSRAGNLVRGDTNGEIDVFVRDRAQRTTFRVSVATSGRQANGMSFEPSIASRRPMVAFTSRATTLGANDKRTDDIYTHNWVTDVTRQVTTHIDGENWFEHSNAPDISSRARVVAFYSISPDLVPADTNGVSDAFIARR